MHKACNLCATAATLALSVAGQAPAWKFPASQVEVCSTDLTCLLSLDKCPLDDPTRSAVDPVLSPHLLSCHSWQCYLNLQATDYRLPGGTAAPARCAWYGRAYRPQAQCSYYNRTTVRDQCCSADVHTNTHMLSYTLMHDCVGQHNSFLALS